MRQFVSVAAAELVVMAATVALAVGLSRTPTPVGDEAQPSPAGELLGFPLPGPPTAARMLFGWVPDGFALTFLVLAAGLYATGVLALRRRGDRWPVGRSIAWALGLAVFAWATVGGLGLYSHVLFSAHMISHMLLSMVAPIGLVLGAPVTLALRALPGPRVRGEASPRGMLIAALHSPVVRVITHPLVAFALFVGSLYVLYFTDLFATLMSHHLGHVAMEFHFLAVGTLFFWVLVGIDPGPRRLPPIARIVLLFAAMPFHAFFSVALLSGTVLLAPDYYRRLDRPYWTDLLADQHLGGGIGWAMGELPILLVLGAVFVQWARSDAREASRFDRANDDELDRYNARLAQLEARSAAAERSPTGRHRPATEAPPPPASQDPRKDRPMSSRTKDKVAARERVAAMRAEQARAARRRRVLLAGGSIGVVVVLLVALVVAKAAGLGCSGGSGGSGSTTSAQPAAASTAVVRAVTGVPAATLDKVGAGSVQAVPRKVDAPALTSGGKPKVLYVGAEYCPFCAAQRWPVVVALSRFGTWSGLGQTTSASDDVYPDTSTLSFHGATLRERLPVVHRCGDQRPHEGQRSVRQARPADRRRQQDVPDLRPAAVHHRLRRRHPVPRPRRLVRVLRRQLRPAAARRDVAPPGSGRPGRPDQPGRQGSRRFGERAHRGPVRGHRSAARRGVHGARRRRGRQDTREGGVVTGQARTSPAEGTAVATSAPRWARLGSLILAVGGLAVSAYLTVEHYSSSTTLACPETGVVNCVKVTTSSYSTLAGVPVALLGLLFFAAMSVLCSSVAWRAASPWVGRARLAGAVAGVVMVRVPGLGRAVPHRRHLPVVHRRARTDGRPVRSPRARGRAAAAGRTVNRATAVLTRGPCRPARRVRRQQHQRGCRRQWKDGHDPGGSEGRQGDAGDPP